MSQHDYNVSNSSGSVVRADINSVLQAIAELNSGVAAPTTTFAYMWWVDTTASRIKQRNGANTGWIDRGSLSDGIFGGFPDKFINGLVQSNNAIDLAHDIDISAGTARDVINSDNITLSASITKQIDAGWAVGTNAGGLDVGSVAGFTWYHLWVIKRPDTGVVDVLFSASATSPTMPTNYTLKRRIGSVLTDITPSIHRSFSYIQSGGGLLTKWRTLFTNYNSINSFGFAPLIITTPLGIRVRPILIGHQNQNAVGAVFTTLSDADIVPTQTSLQNFNVTHLAGEHSYGVSEGTLMTDLSSQIRLRVAFTSGSLIANTIQCSGYFDDRRD